MSYFQITVHVPVPTPSGGEQLQQLEIDVNPEQVIFIAKQPLQPLLIRMLGCQHITQTPVPTEFENLRRFDTLEGGTVWVNPNFIQFIFTPEIGKYKMIFVGGDGVVISTTREDLFKSLKGKPVIELQ